MIRRAFAGVLMAMAFALHSDACVAADWGLQTRDSAVGTAAEVAAVRNGSPAAASGLRQGDLILRVQDIPVRSASEFERILQSQSGATLRLHVSREGWERDVSVSAPTPGKAWIGLKVSDPVPDATGAAAPGALVTGVIVGGPGAQAGLQPGDLISFVEGQAISGTSSLLAMVGDWPIGRPLRLGVSRDGWARELTLMPTGQPVGAAAPLVPSAPMAAARGSKALVAVGDFRVKAATASTAIGDGLREMLVTALFGSGSYAVVERMDLQGLAAEQALSRSRMAREGSAMPERQMDVADIMIYGAVTEFEGAAKGSSAKGAAPGLPFSFGRDTSTAYMAIDVRVVDVASGRILGAQRIVGNAKSSQTAMAGTPRINGLSMPASLGVFSNTPMEQAIRNCVEQAVAYVGSAVPASYFIHQ